MEVPGTIPSVFCVPRSVFCVLRSAFRVQRYAFCVLCSAFCVLRCAFCVLRSAFRVLLSAFCAVRSEASPWHCSAGPGGPTHTRPNEMGAASWTSQKRTPPDPMHLRGLGGKTAGRQGSPTHVPGPSWPSGRAPLKIWDRTAARRFARLRSECGMIVGMLWDKFSWGFGVSAKRKESRAQM